MPEKMTLTDAITKVAMNQISHFLIKTTVERVLISEIKKEAKKIIETSEVKELIRKAIIKEIEIFG